MIAFPCFWLVCDVVMCQLCALAAPSPSFSLESCCIRLMWSNTHRHLDAHSQSVTVLISNQFFTRGEEMKNSSWFIWQQITWFSLSPLRRSTYTLMFEKRNSWVCKQNTITTYMTTTSSYNYGIGLRCH